MSQLTSERHRVLAVLKMLQMVLGHSHSKLNIQHRDSPTKASLLSRSEYLPFIIDGQPKNKRMCQEGNHWWITIPKPTSEQGHHEFTKFRKLSKVIRIMRAIESQIIWILWPTYLNRCMILTRMILGIPSLWSFREVETQLPWLLLEILAVLRVFRIRLKLTSSQ